MFINKQSPGSMNARSRRHSNAQLKDKFCIMDEPAFIEGTRT